VIPARNAAATIGAQLDALAAQDLTRVVDVLVVDNGSTDDTAQVARAYSARLPGLRVVSATSRNGVAHARNVGARDGAGDVILFCDADDVVRPGWVSAMAAALDGSDLVGGRVDVTRVNSPEVVAWTVPPPSDALPVCMRYLPYAIGANMGVRRRLWVRLSGFDETYVGGHEEVDFAWRAQEHGFAIGFVGDAVVDYRLRDNVRTTLRQRRAYGRSYAQLYSKFRHAPIPRTRARHELRSSAVLLLRGPRELLSGRGTSWLMELAWTLGRWSGDIAFRVRSPL
jgi:glycosyltransferase involved in cell wall biosynthesis